MNRIILAILLTLPFLTPLTASAQWSFDIASVEAYISDHKHQKSLLLARSTLEMSNQLLHEYSADAAGDYKELNFDLDKYTRAFDVIDVIYQSTRTALNVRDTYSSDVVALKKENGEKPLLLPSNAQEKPRERKNKRDSRIIGMYLTGLNIKDILRHNNIGKTTLFRILRRHGIPTDRIKRPETTAM